MVISILNNKGGVSKTTTTMLLGGALARMNKKTLLIDFDPQHNLSSVFGIPEEIQYDIIDFIQGDMNHFDLYKHNENLYLIKGNESLITTPLTRYSLKNSIDIISKHFDYIIVDCSPLLMSGEKLLHNEVAMNASDYIISPVLCDINSMNGLKHLFEPFKRVSQTTNPNIKLLGIVLTQVEENTISFKRFFQAYKEQLGEELVFSTYIRRSQAVLRSQTAKMLIWDWDKKSPVADDYDNLAKEIIKKIKR